MGHGQRAGPNAGFTLIELLIVVAVIAVLAAIAIPSYSDYVKRGRIVEGVVPLADIAAKFEQFFQDHRTYEGACMDGTVAPKPADTRHFEYACQLTPAQATATATGKGAMAGFQFQISSSGQRSTLSVPDGWRVPTGHCWSSAKDGSC